MIDINTILTQALAAAVAEATKPLVERIAALETKLAEAAPTPLAERVTALEESKGMTAAAFVTYLDGQEWFWEKVSRFITNNSAITIAALETRLLALEKHTAVLDQHGDIIEYLDNQEWFWAKVGRFVVERVSPEIDAALDHHLNQAPHIGHLVIDKKIEDAIENHEEGMSHYDEDAINNLIDAAIEQHEENKTHGDEDDIEEIVQKLLNSASISISV